MKHHDLMVDKYLNGQSCHFPVTTIWVQVVYIFHVCVCEADHSYKKSRFKDDVGTNSHVLCNITTIQIEVIHLMYECDLDHKYETSISINEDMFERTIISFAFYNFINSSFFPFLFNVTTI